LKGDRVSNPMTGAAKTRPEADRAAAGRPVRTSGAHPDAAAYTRELLELFYPIHYKVGMTLEDAMRLGGLTRKQVAILWIIRTEGSGGRAIERKRIERLLAGWFEVSGSAISKSLRAMARPPRNLLQIEESPQSGREKLVTLTATGGRFLASMLRRGQRFVSEVVNGFDRTEVVRGIAFLRRVTTAVDDLGRKRPAQRDRRTPTR